jgi:hypothetical protein
MTLPSRQDLINKLISKQSSDEIDIYTDEVIRSCQIIERTTQNLFETYHMTKLP